MRESKGSQEDDENQVHIMSENIASTPEDSLTVMDVTPPGLRGFAGSSLRPASRSVVQMIKFQAVPAWARRHPAGKRTLKALEQSAAHSEDAGKVPVRPGEALDGLRRSFPGFS
ncbi:MAG: hypothetical protein QF473_10905 [Planctomycetota bacterium]|jgi:hypothetical protein|nr:hypothetical protein [Planctomycetota bacterium]